MSMSLLHWDVILIKGKKNDHLIDLPFTPNKGPHKLLDFMCQIATMRAHTRELAG